MASAQIDVRVQLTHPTDCYGLICQLEAELDVIAPFWRQPAPWPSLSGDMPRLRRMKYCLKRRMLLMEGMDLGVHVIDGKPGTCFAHPIPPGHAAVEPPPDVGPMAIPATPPPPVNVTEIAFRLRVPLESVEEARARYLDIRPPAPFDASWVQSWLSGGVK